MVACITKWTPGFSCQKVDVQNGHTEFWFFTSTLHNSHFSGRQNLHEKLTFKDCIFRTTPKLKNLYDRFGDKGMKNQHAKFREDTPIRYWDKLSRRHIERTFRNSNFSFCCCSRLGQVGVVQRPAAFNEVMPSAHAHASCPDLSRGLLIMLSHADVMPQPQAKLLPLFTLNRKRWTGCRLQQLRAVEYTRLAWKLRTSERFGDQVDRFYIHFLIIIISHFNAKSTENGVERISSIVENVPGSLLASRNVRAIGNWVSRIEWKRKTEWKGFYVFSFLKALKY